MPKNEGVGAYVQGGWQPDAVLPEQPAAVLPDQLCQLVRRPPSCHANLHPLLQRHKLSWERKPAPWQRLQRDCLVLGAGAHTLLLSPPGHGPEWEVDEVSAGVIAL